MVRPSRDEMLMAIARVAGLRSTCSRASVGAVISREGRPMSLGYNGAPSGMPHCSHDCNCIDYYPPHDSRRVGVSGEHWEGCASVKPCLVSVHAESNAIAFAARHGVTTRDAEMHLTLSPCRSCAHLIINSGIVRVVYDLEYRDNEGLSILRNAGIALEHTG